MKHQRRNHNGGRKPLPERLKRTNKLLVSFNESELADVTRKANAGGYGVRGLAPYLRDAALSVEISAAVTVPELNAQALSLLRTISVNANQVAARLNSSCVANGDELAEILKELRRLKSMINTGVWG